MNRIYRMLRATRILSIPFILSITLKNVVVHLAAQFRLMVLGIVLALFLRLKKIRSGAYLRSFALIGG